MLNNNLPCDIIEAIPLTRLIWKSLKPYDSNTHYTKYELMNAIIEILKGNIKVKECTEKFGIIIINNFRYNTLD
jgi:hypothetical protein